MNQSSKCESFNTGNKLKIKLTSATVTKRVTEAPESFEALKTKVGALICKDESAQSLLEKNLMGITYKDESGKIVTVNDDKSL